MDATTWGTVADWAQAVSSTVVLFLILLQMRQVNQQIIQSEDHTRFDRSWEFVRLYREELRDADRMLIPHIDDFNALEGDVDSDEYKLFICRFFKPRVALFALLNQLIQHQEVDERVLFGYLEEEFNRFVEIGVRTTGSQEFRTSMAAKLNLLLTLWGSQIKSSKLLYGTMPTGSETKV